MAEGEDTFYIVLRDTKTSDKLTPEIVVITKTVQTAIDARDANYQSVIFQASEYTGGGGP